MYIPNDKPHNTMPSVLITGCSDHGIGSALVTSFLQHGFHVFATARNLDRMSKLTGLTNVRLIEMDVLDTAQIRAAALTVQQETGGSLNYLVNNAGQNRFMPLLDEDIEAAEKQFEVNVLGHLRVTQAFAPYLMAAKGTIVFNSSVSGHINVPWQGMGFYL
jgi:1-acylglycerone phosphate reductase